MQKSVCGHCRVSMWAVRVWTMDLRCTSRLWCGNKGIQILCRRLVWGRILETSVRHIAHTKCCIKHTKWLSKSTLDIHRKLDRANGVRTKTECSIYGSTLIQNVMYHINESLGSGYVRWTRAASPHPRSIPNRPLHCSLDPSRRKSILHTLLCFSSDAF